MIESRQQLKAALADLASLESDLTAITKLMESPSETIAQAAYIDAEHITGEIKRLIRQLDQYHFDNNPENWL